MLVNQNIVELLENNESPVALALLEEIKKRKGKPFVIFFQPGAGAPVGNMLKSWRNAGLGGCVDELCEIFVKKLQMRNPIIINTMNLDEQMKANEGIYNHRDIKLSSLTIINDPSLLLLNTVLTITDAVLIEERAAYKPKAWIFDAEGTLKAIKEPVMLEPGFDREPKGYLDVIPGVLNAIWLASPQTRRVVPGQKLQTAPLRLYN